MKTTLKQLTHIDSEIPISIHVSGASVRLEKFLPHMAPITLALSASKNWQTIIESKLLEIQEAPNKKIRVQLATKLSAWAYLGGILNEAERTTELPGKTYDDLDSPEIKKHLQEIRKSLSIALSKAKTQAEVDAAYSDLVAACPLVPRPVNQAKLREMTRG